ncbi:MAG TPA: hypothetical protein VJW76_06195 [Verrucomicrobiae bacterium]|nr:hypothetical protein [Verrucomicrobiae bacterium]
MARNRKHQPAAVRLGPFLKALMLCAFIAVCGVGYVWQKNQLHDLSRRKALMERRLWYLRVLNSQQAGHLMKLQSPRALETRVRELGLGLREAHPTQIVRLIGAPAALSDPAPGDTRGQYARDGNLSPQ